METPQFFKNANENGSISRGELGVVVRAEYLRSGRCKQKKKGGGRGLAMQIDMFTIRDVMRTAV